jgi:hypothetical protein
LLQQVQYVSYQSVWQPRWTHQHNQPSAKCIVVTASLWESLTGCLTKTQRWSNPRVYWTNRVAFRCTWEHLGALATCLIAPTTSLGVPTTSLGACWITLEWSEKNIFTNTTGTCRNHSYYI